MMMKDLGMLIGTFEPIDWRAFYSIQQKRRAAEAEAAARAKARAKARAVLVDTITRVPQKLPCLTCKWEAAPTGCGRSVDPDKVSCCLSFVEWFHTVWPAVVESIKRAAPEPEPPKAASVKEYAPIVTGAEENVKEGQDGLLH